MIVLHGSADDECRSIYAAIKVVEYRGIVSLARPAAPISLIAQSRRNRV